jgi:radical SAM protein with 4Fe4S-binding SPASM domain
LISTAGFDRDNYQEIYRSKQYDKMHNNVLDLLRANEKAGSPIEVTIGFRTNRRVDQVLSDADFQEVKRYKPKIDFTFSFSDWVGRIDFAELPEGFVRRKQPPQTETCVWLYDGPIVFATGDVGLCGCQDVEAKSELVVGNIQQQSLHEIWRSAKVSELRARFMTPRKPDICQNCTSYRNLDALRSFEGLERMRVTERRLRASPCAIPPLARGRSRRHLPLV